MVMLEHEKVIPKLSPQKCEHEIAKNDMLKH